MKKPGRNSPCPCGSGKKFKRCCGAEGKTELPTELRQGRFRYEPCSYGGRGAFAPSILCYEEVEPGSWKQYFCLVKPNTVLQEEDEAAQVARQELDEAYPAVDGPGGAPAFALALRSHGYVNMEDFRVITKPVLKPRIPTQEVFEAVSFLTIESGDDLIVSYAISGDVPDDVISLILLRTPKYEFLLDPRKIGVSVSYDRDEEEPDEDEREFLEEAEVGGRIVTLTTGWRRFVLDLTHVKEEEIVEMKQVFKRMNFDGRFRLCVR